MSTRASILTVSQGDFRRVFVRRGFSMLSSWDPFQFSECISLVQRSYRIFDFYVGFLFAHVRFPTLFPVLTFGVQ